MTEPLPSDAPNPSLVTLTHVIYGLHSLSVLIGITSAVTILGAFVFGWPSIVAVVLNYVKRDEVRGTYLESHFRWQIRTFWFALLWCAVGALLVLTLFGIVLAVITFVAAGLWVVYRIARGWLALNDRKALYF
jgi:uncharacterized membrane protein